MRVPRTIRVPNPAYYTEDRKREEVENSGYAVEDFYPEEYGKSLPDDGGWIMLLMTVKVGRELPGDKVETITVPRMSIWFAVPTTSSNGAAQAIIQTPQGAVHIWPHEYNCCDLDKFLEFSPEEGFHTHFLSSVGAFHEESLFYLRSRGIGKAQAQRMLLVTLKDPLYCWFSFDQEIADCFSEGAGTPYLFHHNHVRRAKAHA